MLEEGQAPLYQWAVYEDPADYPGKWVVRRFAITQTGNAIVSIEKDAEPLIVADSLDEARKVIPQGAYCLGRHPDDDPVIFEVWT